MRIVREGLSPGMQHGNETNVGAEVLWIASDGAQSLRCGPKQQIVDHALILQRDGGDRRGQGEYHVKILNRQQVRSAVLKPPRLGERLTLRAMPITT